MTRHLYQGNTTDNQEDSVTRKRHVNSKKTHCINGHILEGKNLYTWVRPNGKVMRACIACKLTRKKKN